MSKRKYEKKSEYWNKFNKPISELISGSNENSSVPPISAGESFYISSASTGSIISTTGASVVIAGVSVTTSVFADEKSIIVLMYHRFEENKSPSRKVNELDNRGSHFYLALYWAQALAKQTEDPDLATQFTPCATTLAENESAIIDQLNAVQNQSMDIGGYYQPNEEKADAAMRPCVLFNEALNALN